MNPAWIPAFVTVTGLIANAAWGLYNMGERAAIQVAIQKQEAAILSIKEWALEEFVTKETLKLRMAAQQHA
jgi:hypothetical protein